MRVPAVATLVWLLSSRRAASILVADRRVDRPFSSWRFIDDWCPAVLHWVLTIHVIPAEGSYVDLREGAMGTIPPEHGLNKCQETPSGASGIQENLCAAGPRWGACSAPQAPTPLSAL